MIAYDQYGKPHTVIGINTKEFFAGHPWPQPQPLCRFGPDGLTEYTPDLPDHPAAVGGLAAMLAWGIALGVLAGWLIWG